MTIHLILQRPRVLSCTAVSSGLFRLLTGLPVKKNTWRWQPVHLIIYWYILSIISMVECIGHSMHRARYWKEESRYMVSLSVFMGCRNIMGPAMITQHYIMPGFY